MDGGHHSPCEHDSREEGGNVVMENPPTFDPETTWRTDNEGYRNVCSAARQDVNRQDHGVMLGVGTK